MIESLVWPGWSAVQGAFAVVSGVATALTLPMILAQVLQSKNVHVDGVVERGLNDLPELRSRLLELSFKKRRGDAFSWEELRDFGRTLLEYELKWPTIKLAIKHQGRRFSNSVAKVYLEDVLELEQLVQYAVDGSAARIDKFKSDTAEVSASVLKNLNASPGDIEKMRGMMAQSPIDRVGLTELMEAVVSAHLTKGGVQAHEIPDQMRVYFSGTVGPESVINALRHHGGDTENLNVLEAWVGELGSLNSRVIGLSRQVVAQLRKAV